MSRSAYIIILVIIIAVIGYGGFLLWEKVGQDEPESVLASPTPTQEINSVNPFDELDENDNSGDYQDPFGDIESSDINPFEE
ncbi:MAG: hypothetical protein ABH833_03090 [Parcubacteria group bacterium]